MGDILKVVGAVGGGIIGGPAGASIGAGLGGLVGGSSEQQANQQAAQQVNQGFDYLRNSPLGTSYLPNGGAANNAIAQLLGVGGAQGGAPAQGGVAPGIAAAQGTALGHAPGGNNSALQDIRQAMALGRPISTQSWAQAGYGPGGAAPGGGGVPAPAAAGGAPTDPNAGFNNYLNSTGYQFRLGQGQQAITSSNAARGLLNSGATLKAMQRYGQGLASGEFSNYLNQLGGLSGAGLQAGSAIGNAAAAGGAAAGKYTVAAGQAQGQNIAGALQGISAGFTPNAAGTSPFGSAYNYLKGQL